MLEFAAKQSFPGVKQDGIVVDLSSYQMLIPTTDSQGKSCTLAIQIVSVALPRGVPVPDWFLSWGAKVGLPNTIKELNAGCKKLFSDPIRAARRRVDKLGLYATADQLEKKFYLSRQGKDKPYPGTIPASILESGKYFKTWFDAFNSGSLPVATDEKASRRSISKMKSKLAKSRSKLRNILNNVFK